jgi:protein SCO1/2
LNQLTWSLGFFAALAFSLPTSAQHTGNATGQYDADESVAISQAAVGRRLTDLELTNSQGQTVHLSDYLGRPVLVSMVFTSCYHVCPAITRHLASAVDAAREALGEDRFQVLTIGFDTANDSPDAMRQFAREQKVDDPDWAFLSGDAETMKQLTANVGFVHFPSPRGFDHINQVTVVDRDGIIYRQVYGADFDLPWLVEPLKQLVFNRPEPAQQFVLGFFDRVRLFCTVYDPSTGRYRFDYSLFVQIAVGALFLLAFGSWLVLEIIRARRRKSPTP